MYSERPLPLVKIDVCPAAESCPFDRTYRLATMQSSANGVAQRPATVSPRWGADRYCGCDSRGARGDTRRHQISVKTHVGRRLKFRRGRSGRRVTLPCDWQLVFCIAARCRTLSQNHRQVFAERSNWYARAALRNHLDGKPPIEGMGKGMEFPQNPSPCLTAPVDTDGVRDARC